MQARTGEGGRRRDGTSDQGTALSRTPLRVKPTSAMVELESKGEKKNMPSSTTGLLYTCCVFFLRKEYVYIDRFRISLYGYGYKALFG